mgnify:CR=1 FL=1
MSAQPKHNLSIDEKLDLVLAEILAIHGIKRNSTAIALSLNEAMVRTGHRSTSAWFRWRKTVGLFPYRRGYYRLADIDEAIALAAANQRARRRVILSKPKSNKSSQKAAA